MEKLELPVLDKSTWGDGPWQDEPDRVDFTHAGLACFVRRNSEHGHLCGYVGVPREHPLYGREYGEADLRAHGGVNYSGACDEQSGICHVPAPGMPADVWWFGFDCAHGFDLSPAREAREVTVREMMLKAGVHTWKKKLDRPHAMREVYRALPYVRRETEKLAEQLAEMEPAVRAASLSAR